MDERSRLPIRSVTRHAHAPPELSEWLSTLPVAQQALEGFDFARTTIIVGENGSGKSTLVEALATAIGLPHGGGSSWDVRSHGEGAPELADHLQIVRGATAPRGAFVLRAETMHENMVHLMEIGSSRGFAYSRRSHGEMFIDMLSGSFMEFGLWILDEPESALSFTTSLSLLQLIGERQRSGLQTIMSTHSPILASAEEASVFEIGNEGLHPEPWDRLDMVDHWRRFLTDPSRYTRHFDD